MRSGFETRTISLPGAASRSPGSTMQFMSYTASKSLVRKHQKGTSTLVNKDTKN
jgi:hypothetical protein